MKTNAEGNGTPERGYVQDKEALLRRLSRIEGQVRGVRGMVEDEAYCIDVITQLSAVTRALDGVALQLLDDHAHHCVRDAVDRGGEEADERLDEVIETVRRFARTR
jgi:CsoR family transcriptional regulator, copper-sensing transcriptional repressor